MGVKAIAFASKLHGESYYGGVFEALRGELERFGAEVCPEVVTSDEDAQRVASEFADPVVIALVLTGGVSRQIQGFALLSRVRALSLVAHGEHNSLPSAISARAALEEKRVGSTIFFCRNASREECRGTVIRAVNVSRAAYRVIGTRVGLVGPSSLPPESAVFQEKFGWRVELIPLEEFDSLVEELRGLSAGEFAVKISGVEGLNDERWKLDRVAPVYLAMRRLFAERGLSAAAVDCFPYLVKHRVTPCLAIAVLNSEGLLTACEADLYSALLMLVSRELTGSAGWIANLACPTDRGVLFAHCTITLDMACGAKLTTHFESGYPAAVTAQLKHSDVTLVAIDRKLSSLYVAQGRVHASGFISSAACRTQAEVSLNLDPERLALKAPRNHHLLMPGKVAKELYHIAKLLNLGYVEYS
ncbi:MAG: hypothetical protein LM590_04015 [Thermofilum sp.]|jgi:L-fucose isomerase-like protein|nr:hypothetical protein [Thermofilum sp.]